MRPNCQSVNDAEPERRATNASHSRSHVAKFKLRFIVDCHPENLRFGKAGCLDVRLSGGCLAHKAGGGATSCHIPRDLGGSESSVCLQAAAKHQAVSHRTPDIQTSGFSKIEMSSHRRLPPLFIPPGSPYRSLIADLVLPLEYPYILPSRTQRAVLYLYEGYEHTRSPVFLPGD